MWRSPFLLLAAALASSAQNVITGTASNTNTLATTFASSLAAPVTSTSASYTVKYNDTTAGYPTKTLLIPLNYLGNVAGSIITAAPESTVYGLACLHLLADGGCSETPSVTLTEGESTLMYTLTNTNPSLGPTTINCALTGGTRATQVVCTGASSVSGLGALSSVSTLAGSQLSYIPVSITGGAERLSGVATATSAAAGSSAATSAGGQGASKTSSAEGCKVTAGGRVGGVVGGAVAAVAAGVVVVLGGL